MRASEDFSEVSPDEEFDRGFEFVSRFTFADDEVVSSVLACLCEVVSGEDDLAAQAHVGATAVLASETSGRVTVAAVRLSGLVAGTTYRITMRVLTSRGQTLELYADQPCLARD